MTDIDLNQSASDLLSQLEKRQDWVLEELDQLNGRIEDVLKAFGRPAQEVAVAAENASRTHEMA